MLPDPLAPAPMSLWGHVTAGNQLSARWLHDAHRSVALHDLACGSSLDCARAALAGRSVLVATKQQLAAALALLELDSIARRLVVSPPDVTAAHLGHVLAAAAIDTVVSDGAVDPAALPAGVRLVHSRDQLVPGTPAPVPHRDSEWVLLTSGTTGVPKLVVHTLASLIDPIVPPGAAADRTVRSTFYDIRRYGGMHMFLRAAICGGSLVLSGDGSEGVADFLARAGRHAVTYISGTPSHWRRALMSPASGCLAPKFVRLSGEIVDQPIIDDLAKCYPGAAISHAFATTESGVAFAVEDGRAGFPAGLLGRRGNVEMKLDDGSLRIRSPAMAQSYLGAGNRRLRDADGFVDTGDIIDVHEGRCWFVGRRDGVINVGGLKVHPEEVEAAINRHPAVQMALAKARKNPFTGTIVVADVVLRPGSIGAAAALTDEILATCRRALAPHKVPAAIRFVDGIGVGNAGKLARSDA